ncbi:M10 family metallopeptidase C-terminal domain-containing protein [Ancylobacter defluvii]|uniref:Serralysin n=1 Tax=Ancylobacter defluvii TaxID=1282440 RepID=A0A9W6NBG3_9HYPH|nr:M10 family metallopeptidase C-terminal domain-containing protein [Ancylobacter defluvii]MBS7589063.1 M10 family metallopeptidase C-terminal domain-containing protein [Ancylobacter defluvii]GLK84673.1 serralysin [Ancylobacter defluvii]
MAGAVTVDPTGNDDIDGLIAGTRWTGQITFSFLDGVNRFEQADRFVLGGLLAGEYSETPVDGPPVTMTTYGSVDSLVNAKISYKEPTLDGLGMRHYPPGVLKFRDVNTTDLYNTNAPGESGEATFVGIRTTGVSGRPQFFSGTEFNNFIYMKAIGAALGLKSASETGGVADVAVPATHDSFEFSVMSQRPYVGGPIFTGRSSYYAISSLGLPQTFMPLDIQALQRLYGADYSTNAGDTVYQWSPLTGQIIVNGDNSFTAPQTNKIFMTVWDGGGTDTYDLSNYSGAMSIDLSPGAWSLFSQAQRGLISESRPLAGELRYVHGNVYNALLYNDNPASLIENAITGQGDDTLRGNIANNVLNGGAGADTMAGLTGDDSYVVDNAGDVVTEAAGEGTDLVYVRIADYVLPANLENAKAENGFGAIDIGGNAEANVLSGNGSSNKLYGGAGNDQLYGFAGHDHLDGGTGFDQMSGGRGDDTYIVDSLSDVVYEAPNEGTDTLWTSVNRGLDNDFENIVLFGLATDAGGNGQDNIVTGNELNNNLYGGGGSDSLYGHDGSDRLFGEDGNDYMTGGKGTDAYYSGGGYDYAIIEEGGGVDYFVDWNVAQDRVVFDSAIFSSIGAAMSAAFQNGTDVVIWDGGDGIVLQNAKLADLTTSNFLIT